MDYVHECGFCGWSRPAASPVLCVPACARCGCLLDARPRDTLAAGLVAAMTAGAGASLPGSLTTDRGPALVALLLVFAVALLAAAAHAGMARAGVPGALTAVGCAALALA